jgi:hypothetical protein
MTKKRSGIHDTFRSPEAERRYRNRQRELEKKKKRAPIGRRDWEEQ